MSFVTRQVAHCDQCSHEWLVVGATPTHCAKCKSRKWNKGAGSTPVSATKPNMQALRDIVEGGGQSFMEIDLGMEQVLGQVAQVEIPICGKTWWEDGEQYECLMDAGHRLVHGLRGMVRRLDS